MLMFLPYQTNNAEEKEKVRRKELKVAVMMAYLVVIVILVYALMLSVNILSYAGQRGQALKYNYPIPEFTADYIWLEGIQIGATSIMAAINPVIYHWKSPDFRRAFQQILRRPLDNDHGSSSGSHTSSGRSTSTRATDA